MTREKLFVQGSLKFLLKEIQFAIKIGGVRHKVSAMLQFQRCHRYVTVATMELPTIVLSTLAEDV